jgi:hypothetical protein
VRRILIVLAALLVFAAPPVHADIEVVADPDQWIEQALKDITAGKTDDFARKYLKLIDKTNIFDTFAGNMRVLGTIAPPAFIEKVWEGRYGTSMRETIYLALYNRTDYVYFKFTAKKNHGGWLISNFEFKSEPAALFPKDFLPAQ